MGNERFMNSKSEVHLFEAIFLALKHAKLGLSLTELKDFLDETYKELHRLELAGYLQTLVDLNLVRKAEFRNRAGQPYVYSAIADIADVRKLRDEHYVEDEEGLTPPSGEAIKRVLLAHVNGVLREDGCPDCGGDAVPHGGPNAYICVNCGLMFGEED